jgi:cytochrome oxidase Cu insertion factor (SCO1/SenC/PrrC family)
MKKYLFFASIALLSVATPSLAGDGNNPKSNTSTPVKIGLNVGDTAPELKYKDPTGKLVSLASLRGKVVLIDFWA